jgi:hypothetical protein
MTKVKSHMSMPVNGFVAGLNPAQDNPMGTNGHLLHVWTFNDPEQGNKLAA